MLLMIEHGTGSPVVKAQCATRDEDSESGTNRPPDCLSQLRSHPKRGGVVWIEATHALRSVAGEGKDCAADRLFAPRHAGCANAWCQSILPIELVIFFGFAPGARVDCTIAE